MGVYIKGMDMPKDGGHIQLVVFSNGAVMGYDKNKVCAVEIKAPHGRLIEADEIKPNLYDPRLEALNNGKATYYANMEQIHEAPTVIEAEGKDDV